MAGAIGWAAALPVATYIAAQPQPVAAGSLFALAVYAVGNAVCHQLAARSFHLWAHQMPVCARCAGIYAGAAAAALGAMVWRSAAMRASNARVLVAIALAPAAASLIFEWATGVTPSNLVRAATGVVLGGTVVWLVFADLTRRVERTTL